jgi:hypothetical protein
MVMRINYVTSHYGMPSRQAAAGILAQNILPRIG